MHLHAVGLHAEQSLKSAPDVFKEAADQQPSEQNIGLVKGLADRVRGDAAKIGVMFGGGATLSDVEASGLLATLQQAVEALCICMHSLTFQAGPSLREELKAGATSVALQCAALARLVGEGQAGAITHAVATVWDSCDAVKRQALDNKSALFRRLATVLRAGKDAVREMNELTQENNDLHDNESCDTQEDAAVTGANGHEAAASTADSGTANGGISALAQAQPTSSSRQAAAQPSDEGSDEEEEEDAVGGAHGADLSDGDFTSEPLTASEREILSAAKELMQLALQAVQLLAKPLLKAAALLPDAVEGWESCVWHTRSLQRGLEDLGAALYSPQDHEEVSGAAEAIVISLECMLDEIPEGGEGDTAFAEALGGLQAQLVLTKSRLDGLLAAAEQ